MASKPALSALEWLGVGAAVLKTFSLGLSSLFVIPLQRSKGPPTFSSHLSFAISHAYTSSFSPKALVATSPTTDEGYQSFVVSHELSAKSITLPDGTRAHWLGDPAAEKILLFFHGGGYLLPAVTGHFHLLHESLKAVEKQETRLGVLFLAYDLSFYAPYPRQLQQASALLQHAITVLNKKAENIYLTGDSAGGNLALALLSHILHPHPQVEGLRMNGKLGGAALLSPWVTFDTISAQSMRTNRHRDALTPPVLGKWAAIFQGSAPSDPYLEPLKASPEWFQDLPVAKVLIIAGADELFVDDIRAFAERLSVTHAEVAMHAVPGEAHDHLVMEFLMGHPRTQQRDIYEKWLCEMVR